MKALVLASAAAVGVCVSGCGGGNDLMPMKLGTKWTYTVRSGFRSYVEEVTVEREQSVAGESGFYLGGALGPATLAWGGSRLLASQVASNRFDPPIPILVVGSAGWGWKGKIRGLGGGFDATMTAVATAEKLDLAGRKLTTTKSDLAIEVGGKTVRLTTWFSPGIGIVRQEQRTDGRQDLAIELLSGP